MTYAQKAADQKGIKAVLSFNPVEYVWVDGTRHDRDGFDFSDYRLLEQDEAVSLLGGVDAFLDFERVNCRMFWDGYAEAVVSIGTGNPFEKIEDVFAAAK